MAAEDGEPDSKQQQSALEMLKKQLKQRKSSSHSQKTGQCKDVKKKMSIRSQKIYASRIPPAFVPTMPHPPVRTWMPQQPLMTKIPPQYVQPQMPYSQMPPTMVRIRKRRTKIHTNMKKELKAGTMISNVSNALEDFKRRRDKFLQYLSQLQEDLNKLNLPTASKEKMETKEIEIKKKDIKKKKKKSQKSKLIPDQKVTKKRIDMTMSDVLPKKKSKGTSLKKTNSDRKLKNNKTIAKSLENLKEWKGE